MCLLNIEVHQNLVFVLLEGKFFYYKSSAINTSFNHDHICTFSKEDLKFYIIHKHQYWEDCNLPKFSESLESNFIKCFWREDFSLQEKWSSE